MKTILAIDDDRSFLNILELNLKKRGFEVFCRENYDSAKIILDNYPIDCIILDVKLADDENGFDICEKIKDQKNIPIIFLSNYGEDENRIQSFRSGGDDFVSKPCNIEELVLRIHRRIHPVVKEVSDQLEFGKLLISITNRKVTYNSNDLFLTNSEFNVIKFLAEHKGKTFTHIDLFEQIWEEPSLNNAHTVQVHISSLRKKLNEVSPNHEFIQTLWGKGYRFCGILDE